MADSKNDVPEKEDRRLNAKEWAFVIGVCLLISIFWVIVNNR